MLDSPEFFALSTLVLATGLAARFAIFRASCTLAEAGEPEMVRSLLLVAGVLILTVGCALLPFYLFPSAPEDSRVGHIALSVATMVATASLAAVLYSRILATPLRRGAVVASAELLLNALLAALIIGMVLVVLAALQLQRRPEAPRSPAAAALRAWPLPNGSGGTGGTPGRLIPGGDTQITGRST